MLPTNFLPLTVGIVPPREPEPDELELELDVRPELDELELDVELELEPELDVELELEELDPARALLELEDPELAPPLLLALPLLLLLLPPLPEPPTPSPVPPPGPPMSPPEPVADPQAAVAMTSPPTKKDATNFVVTIIRVLLTDCPDRTFIVGHAGGAPDRSGRKWMGAFRSSQGLPSERDSRSRRRLRPSAETQRSLEDHAGVAAPRQAPARRAFTDGIAATHRCQDPSTERCRALALSIGTTDRE